MHHFLSLLLVIIGLQVSVQITGRRSERSASRYYRSVLTVSNGIRRGSWGQRKMCPSETYAAGFSLKDDNRGLTEIHLHCIKPHNSLLGFRWGYTSVQSEVGSSVDWKKIKWCPCCFLRSFQLSVKSFQGTANDIRFKCSRGIVLGDDGTSWGEWGGWSQTCEGIGICGIMTRTEEPWGNRSYTALNDVRMYCCN